MKQRLLSLYIEIWILIQCFSFETHTYLRALRYSTQKYPNIIKSTTTTWAKIPS